jgi:hypothetical protein
LPACAAPLQRAWRIHDRYIADLLVDPKVKEFTSRRWELLIDGDWVKAKSEQTFQTHSDRPSLLYTQIKSVCIRL